MERGGAPSGAGMSDRGTQSAATIESQWRERPRDRFVRASLGAALVLMLAAWLAGGYDWGDLLSERRAANLQRFVQEIRPHPLQGEPWDWGVAWRWSSDLFEAKGRQAVGATVAISLAAIVLAALGGALLALPAARNFALSEPFLAALGEPPRARRWLWKGVATTTRAGLMLLRAMPEYVVAFLLLAVWGPTPWTAVLALALHNIGILGRLGAESIENVERRGPRSLRSLGASRMQIAAWNIAPEIWPRYLLYIFYRWETCVREATVLGLLGIVSLGFWIDDARARGHADEMVYFVLLGAAIVLVGDWVSSLARAALRRWG